MEAAESPRRAQQGAADLGLESFGAVPDDHGISLEELSRAYAELIAGGDDPYEPAPERPPVGAAPVEPELELEEWAEEPSDDSACAISPRTILEAMLFVGHPENQPLESQQIASLMRGVRAAEIDDIG